MTSERVQVILESSQRRALAARSKQTGRSISELVREALDIWMSGEKETRLIRAQALEDAAALRKRIAAHSKSGRLPDAVDILQQAREEQTGDIHRR